VPLGVFGAELGRKSGFPTEFAGPVYETYVRDSPVVRTFLSWHGPGFRLTSLFIMGSVSCQLPCTRRRPEIGRDRPVTHIAASSAPMLAQLISETYLSVVAFGLRRASPKACFGASSRRAAIARHPFHELPNVLMAPHCPLYRCYGRSALDRLGTQSRQLWARREPLDDVVVNT
jgi:hypothetical protein